MLERYYYSVNAYSPVTGGGGEPPAADYIASVNALSPAAFWGLQEASGNAADLTGNGWTATAAGSITYEASGPTINGEALKGVTLSAAGTAHFSVSSSLTDPGIGGFTVSAWVKHAAGPGAQFIFSPYSGTAGTFYLRKGNSYGVQCVMMDTTGGVYASAFEGSDTFDDTWQWVAARYDTTTLRVYHGTGTFDTTSFSGTWKRDGNPTTYIGRQSTTYWDGGIALLAYWASPLTDGEMTSLRTGVF